MIELATRDIGDAIGKKTSPEVRLNQLLVAKGTPTISVAESCTGGNVAHRITTIAGSSNYFLGGIVSYANSAKIHLLGLTDELLDVHGAVSAECAAAMAAGARDRFGSDLAVSTTGIAGPATGATSKPVGLVFFGFATGRKQDSHSRQFSGSRIEIIESATDYAISLLVQMTEQYFGSH